jgi:hypothetical protein
MRTLVSLGPSHVNFWKGVRLGQGLRERRGRTNAACFGGIAIGGGGGFLGRHVDFDVGGRVGYDDWKLFSLECVTLTARVEE